MDIIEELRTIQNNSNYDSFSMDKKMAFTKDYFNLKFSSEPAYQNLNPKEKDTLLKRFLYTAPNIKDEFTNNLVKEMSIKYYQEEMEELKTGSKEKFGSEENKMKNFIFGNSFMRNTGVLPLLGLATDPVMKALGKDRFTTEYLLSDDMKQASEFFSHYMNEMGDSAAFDKGAGQVLGVAADILAFNAVWPSIAVAKVPKMKGGKLVGEKLVRENLPQAIGRVLSDKTKNKVLTNSLRYGFPIGTEAAVEGFFGTLRDDYIQKRETGTGVFEQGANEVMKHWGIWALEDFVTGSVFTTLLGSGRALMQARKYHKATKKFRSFQETINDAVTETIDEIGSPRSVPEVLKSQPVQIQDKVVQVMGEKKLFKEGLAKADEFPIERMYYAANDTKTVVAQQPTGEFRLHYLNKNGDEITRTIDTLSETNDFLAEQGRIMLKDMPEGKREVFLTAHPEIKERIKTLDEIDGIFNFKKNSDLPPELQKSLKKTKGPDPQQRIYLTKQEADYLGTNSPSVQRAKFTISEETLQNANVKKHPFEKMGGAKVVPDNNNPNGIVVMKKTATPENYQVARAKAQKALQNEGSLDEGMLIREYLIEGGFDSTVLPNGELVTLFPNRVKLISSLGVEDVQKLKDIEQVFKKGSRVSKRAQIESDIRATIDLKKIQDPTLFSKGLEFVADNPTNKNVNNITRMFARNLGDGYNVQVSKIPNSSKKKVLIEINDKTKSMSVKYADVPNTSQGKRRFIKEYTEELDRVLEGKNLKKHSPFTMQSVQKSTKYTLGDTNNTVKWLDDLARSRRIGKIDEVGSETYNVTRPDGNTIKINGIENLEDTIVRASYNFEDAQYDLAREGILLKKVTKKDVTQYIATPPKGEPIKSESLQEVLNQIDFTPGRLDIHRYGPKVVAIDNNTVDVIYRDGTLFGPRKSVMRSLESFENKNYVTKMQEVFSDNKGKIHVHPDSSYTVNVPSMGTTFTFKDLKGARKFLQSEIDNFATVYSAARKKGLRLSPHQKGFLLSDGKTTFTPKNMDEVKAAIRSYGDPTTSAPDLIPAEAELQDVINTFNKGELPEVDTYAYNRYPDVTDPQGEISYKSSMSDQFREKFAVTDRFMEKYTEKIGDRQLMQYYRDVGNGHKLAQQEINVSERDIRSLFVDPKTQKVIPIESRRKIFYWAGAQTPEEYALALEKTGGVELTATEQGIMERVKRTYESLGTKFGIKTQDLIHNYMPRLMQWSEENAALVNQMTNAEELFEAFSKDTGLSSGINFFGKNQRVSDILYFGHQNDALDVLLQYSARGHKNFFIEPAWNNLQKYMMSIKEKVPGHVMNRLNYYKEMITSSYRSDGMEFTEKMGEKFFHSLSKMREGKKTISKVFGDQATAQKYGRNMFKTMFSLNYIAMMGYRPWLAIRNSFQPWTTLAPRFGFGAVMEGIKDVADLGENYYKYLNQIGVVGNKYAILNDVLEDTTFLGKLLKGSLSFYQSSDDYTRAIGARVAERALDDGISKLQRGIVKTKDDFKAVTRLRQHSPDIADRITNLVFTGDDLSISQAKALYMNKVASDSFFDYNKPQAAQINTSSIIGRIFGQYSTYAHGYRANLARGLEYGTFAEKAGFLSRFMIGHAALWGSFTALGINARNFIPFGPLVFTGGPMFDLGLTGLQAMDFTSYKGDIARKELVEKLSYMVPGSLHYHYLKKAINYINEGDLWKAWLSLTSTPTIND